MDRSSFRGGSDTGETDKKQVIFSSGCRWRLNAPKMTVLLASAENR
jgi:hypothetical protein